MNEETDNLFQTHFYKRIIRKPMKTIAQNKTITPKNIEANNCKHNGKKTNEIEFTLNHKKYNTAPSIDNNLETIEKIQKQ